MKLWFPAIAVMAVAQVAFAQPGQVQVSAAEAGLVNCTISSVRLEDQLKAAQARIAELEKQASGDKGSDHPPPGPPPEK